MNKQPYTTHTSAARFWRTLTRGCRRRGFMSAWLLGSLALVVAASLAVATPLQAQPTAPGSDSSKPAAAVTPAAGESPAQIVIDPDTPAKLLGAAATPATIVDKSGDAGETAGQTTGQLDTQAGEVSGADAASDGDSGGVPGVTSLDQRCGGGSGRIDPSYEQEWWSFDASAGEALVIKAVRTGGGLDGWLSLFDPSGREVAFDDDSGGDYNPLIRYTARATGRYNVRVSSYNGATAGDYRVEVCWGSPPTTTCPDSQYMAQYFNNMNLGGAPAVTRCESWPIDHDWSGGRPVDGIGDNNFSVRWTGRAYIADGTYRFIARADDGVRVWVGGQLIIDAWRDQSPTEYVRELRVSSGTYDLRIEYFENGGGAVAQFRWERGATPPSCQGTSVNVMDAVTGYTDSGGRSFCFRGDGGRWVSIRAVAASGGAYPGPGGLDPALRLYSPGGQLLGENDDAFGYGTNAMLVAYLPQSGVYRLEIRGYGSTSGNYRMHLGLNRKATVADANSSCDVGEGDRWLVEHFLGQSSYNDERYHADIDLDGRITARDHAFVMSHWGRRCQ